MGAGSVARRERVKPVAMPGSAAGARRSAHAPGVHTPFSMTDSKESLSPDRFEAVLRSISDGVFTIDLDGRITCFNRAAEEITGVPRRCILFFTPVRRSRALSTSEGVAVASRRRRPVG